MNQETSAQVKAAVQVVVAIGETIKELGSVPSGHLYAQLMGRMSLDTYNKIIGVLVKTGAVKEEGYLLTWVGK
jgi:hypothetical protein